jgi:hypothetical protein
MYVDISFNLKSFTEFGGASFFSAFSWVWQEINAAARIKRK